MSQNNPEEKAIILLSMFMKKTSVLYDTQSIIDILLDKQKAFEELTQLDQEILTHILSVSVFKMSKDNELKHYWKNAQTFLTLEVINELIQTFRVTDTVLEPLLAVMAISI